MLSLQRHYLPQDKVMNNTLIVFRYLDVIEEEEKNVGFNKDCVPRVNREINERNASHSDPHYMVIPKCLLISQDRNHPMS